MTSYSGDVLDHLEQIIVNPKNRRGMASVVKLTVPKLVDDMKSSKFTRSNGAKVSHPFNESSIMSHNNEFSVLYCKDQVRRQQLVSLVQLIRMSTLFSSPPSKVTSTTPVASSTSTTATTT